MQRPPTPSVSAAGFESRVPGSKDWEGIEEYVFLWFEVYAVKQQRLHWVTELFLNYYFIFLGHLEKQGRVNVVNFSLLFFIFLFFFPFKRFRQVSLFIFKTSHEIQMLKSSAISNPRVW